MKEAMKNLFDDIFVDAKKVREYTDRASISWLAEEGGMPDESGAMRRQVANNYRDAAEHLEQGAKYLREQAAKFDHRAKLCK